MLAVATAGRWWHGNRLAKLELETARLSTTSLGEHAFRVVGQSGMSQLTFRHMNSSTRNRCHRQRAAVWLRGLSVTGPEPGGPNYLLRFAVKRTPAPDKTGRQCRVAGALRAVEHGREEHFDLDLVSCYM